MSEFKLIYKEGDSEYEFIISKDRVEMGRMDSSDLVLNDFGISRSHAAIVKKGNKFYLEDMGSRNGTFVNNVRIAQAEIKPGDTLALGRFPLKFEGPASVKEAPLLVEDNRKIEASLDHTIIKSMGVSLGEKGGTVIATPKKNASVLSSPNAKKQDQSFFILTEVARTLISLDKLDEILNTFVDLVFKYLPVDRGFLMLGNSEGELEPKLVKHRKPERDQITISKTIAHKVFKEKVSILTTDAMMDPRFSSGDSIRFHGIRSAMCVPLWVEGEVVGILFVDSPIASVKFGEDDLNLLSSLGNYAAVAIQRARLTEKIKEEADARAKLERYHSPAVINRLLQTKGSAAGLNIEAQELECSILFADIVSFTTYTEKMEPKKVGLFLNEFFSQMTDIIFEYEGTLDKFLGDGLMAVFGAPFPYKDNDHALRSVSAATDMMKAVEKFNEDASLGFNINIRIGINSGRVVAGDIGSPKRIEYTVLGDTVNVASRLEKYIAKPNDIVIGEATYKAVQGKFKTKLIGEIDLKGRASKMKTYHVHGKK
jgi:adenylate cyclase